MRKLITVAAMALASPAQGQDFSCLITASTCVP